MFIRTLLQTFLIVSTSVMLTVQALQLESGSERNLMVISVAVLLVLVCTPLVSGFKMAKHRKYLLVRKYKRRFSSLYLNLKTDARAAVLYYPLFMLRRLLVSGVIAFLADYPFA